MATESRRPGSGLIDEMADRPGCFEFFQAVRLLELVQLETAQCHETDEADRCSAAQDFRTNNSNAFPATAIERLEVPTSNGQAGILWHSCNSLTGSSGVLPFRFTGRLIELARRGSGTLSAFQDLLNSHVASLSYLAWQKHFVIAAYESQQRRGRSQSAKTFHDALLGAVGLCGPELETRADPQDSVALFFAGHFSRTVRNSWSLRALLASTFGIGVKLEQFVGQWLAVPPCHLTRLDATAPDELAPSRLGSNTVVGAEFWEVQSKIRFTIGPLDDQQYHSFLPGGALLKKMTDIIRLYIGIDLEFDIVLELDRNEVREYEMTGEASRRLGWTTFLVSDAPPTNVLGACFDYPCVDSDVAVPA